MSPTIALYPLLTAALYYLGSRAKITEAIWSRYPKPFARFMDCSACTGFWYGLIIQVAFGFWLHVDFFGLPYSDPATPLIVGLCALVWTPIVAALMQHSLDTLGYAAIDGDDNHG